MAQRDREGGLRAETEGSGEIQMMPNLVYHNPEFVFYCRS